MTRDEVIAVHTRHAHKMDGWLDTLAEIGVLKFDEPETPPQILRNALKTAGYYPHSVNTCMDIIATAGLKLVKA